jgi:hypothetical protein
MIGPALSPYTISLLALTQPAQLAETPAAQAVTKRPSMPSGKSEMPRQRDKRDRDAPEKNGRGQATDLVV